MKKMIYPLLVLLLACNGNPEKTKSEKIDDLVKEAFDKKEFIGNVLVADQGSIIYKRSFGKSDNENSLDNTDTTKFLIASISKPITAILILRLVDKGVLTLDDTIDKYFRVENSQVGKINIHQLLTHTSGINEIINKDKDMDLAVLINYATLNFKPGSDFEYSNSGYALLKEVAEIASQKKYADLVDEEIFDVVNMTSSGVARNSSLGTLANGYKDAAQAQRVSIDFPIENIDGPGSIYSTTGDLYKLDRALYTNRLLSKESIEKMVKQQVSEKYGYGWFIKERGGVWDVYWHKGDLPGFTSFLSRRIKKNQCIILLSNSENAALDDLENDMAKILKTKN